MKPRSRGNGYLAAAVVYALAIATVSHLPGNTLAKLGLKVWDKALHTAEFLPLGFLVAMFVIKRYGERARPASVIAVVTGMGLVLGTLDEFHQWFVPGRTSSWGDVVADALGCLAGSLIALAVSRWPWRTT